MPADQRGLAFGVHRAMDNAGAVIGPLVAAGLLALQLPLRQIIAWSLLPGLLCTGLALALRDRPGSSSSGPTAHSTIPTVPWRFSALPPELRRYLVVAVLFTLSNSSNLFLLLRARQLGVPETAIPLLWAAISAVAMLGAAPLSAWSDRVGRRRLLVGVYGAYGLFYLLIAHLQGSGPWIAPLFASYGLFLAATEGVEKALVADLALEGERGTAFGWFNLVTGLALLPASLLFGWLYETFSPQSAFTLAAGFALAAAGLMAVGPTPAADRPTNLWP